MTSDRAHSSNPGLDPGLDETSRGWVERLAPGSATRGEAVTELHALLLGFGLREASRRAGTNGLRGPELDDLAHQSADDAVLSVLRRLPDFRGESRFTTWAYKFVVLEVGQKVSRHAWRRDGVRLESEAWDRLPARLGAGPEEVATSRALAEAVREAVHTVLTEHQRTVFHSLVVEGVPVDVLAESLGSTRNAIYKSMFDARRKLRGHLVSTGYVTLEEVS